MVFFVSLSSPNERLEFIEKAEHLAASSDLAEGRRRDFSALLKDLEAAVRGEPLPASHRPLTGWTATPME